MSFSFLPWPVHVLLLTGSAIWICLWLVETRKEYPLSFKAGFLLIVIAGVLVAVHKIVDNTRVFLQYLAPVRNSVMIIGFPGVLLLLIGIYIKENNDPYSKKRVLSILSAMLAGFTICGLVLIYCEFFY